MSCNVTNQQFCYVHTEDSVQPRHLSSLIKVSDHEHKSRVFLHADGVDCEPTEKMSTGLYNSILTTNLKT